MTICESIEAETLSHYPDYDPESQFSGPVCLVSHQKTINLAAVVNNSKNTTRCLQQFRKHRDYVLDPKIVNGTYLDYKVAQYDPEK